MDVLYGSRLLISNALRYTARNNCTLTYTYEFRSCVRRIWIARILLCTRSFSALECPLCNDMSLLTRVGGTACRFRLIFASATITKPHTTLPQLSPPHSAASAALDDHVVVVLERDFAELVDVEHGDGREVRGAALRGN